MNTQIMFSVLLSTLLAAVSASLNAAPEVSLTDDPSLFPGHLEPLGAKQPRTEIEVLTDYPGPHDFFENYIKARRPFLLKGGAFYQPAYKLWNDEYMKSFPEAATATVQVEPNLKEIREAGGFEISFKEFIDRYHDEKIYMVDKVPSFLQKDIFMPPPLRCNSTRKLMLDHVTWMSTGGTKSVLHSDDLDNVNCLFRGSKELLFIDPMKYAGKVPIDKPRGGYSSLDVEKVNFTKFPAMREVEYIHCKMEEGDCLFIPWRWYHQVNSVANKDSQNIAVNIWFQHDADHVPEQCDIPLENSTLNNFAADFRGMENAYGGAEEGEQLYPLLGVFEHTLTKTKYNRANFKTFLSILKKVHGVIAEKPIDNLEFSEDFQQQARQVFDLLNVKKDKVINSKDFDTIENESLHEKIEKNLNIHLDKMQEILLAQLNDETNANPEVDETLEKSDNNMEGGSIEEPKKNEL